MRVLNTKDLQVQQDHTYLQNMPSADMYERSYMHKEIVCNSKLIIFYIKTIVLVSNKYEYIFTMSIDGFLKFWKKI